jgi:Kef-type K+ transport system membrane component KefB
MRTWSFLLLVGLVVASLARTGRTQDADPGPALGPDAAVAIDIDAISGAAATPYDAAPPPPDAAPPPPDAAPPPPDAAPADLPPPAEPAGPAGDSGERTVFAIKVIAGLMALLALAYLGGHRRVARFQERVGIASIVAAGFPFVALGLIASHPDVAILDAPVLAHLRPVMHFGLGWLGFIIGAQLDIRVLDQVPRGTGYLILVEALAPFAATAAACGALMIAFGMSLDDPAFWRDVILLGTAAAMTAPRRFRGFANRGWNQGKGVDVLMAQLDEIVGVVGLLFITAYFRDPDVGAWQMPATAWLFVSIGLGVVIGVLIYAMVRIPRSNAEFLAVVLGAIAFASGLAGYLRLSPIVVCFLAGALVVNFPCEQRGEIFRILNHLERPVHLIFLILAGALWSVSDWRGWVLVPVFVGARIAGKWLGMTGARAAVGGELPAGFADERLLFSPMSGLAIGLVISLQSNYADPGLPWIVTAVIGAAIASELLVQIIDPGGGDARSDDRGEP